MDNLLSYYGLVDAGISTSEKDLPVNSGFVKKRYEFVNRYNRGRG